MKITENIKSRRSIRHFNDMDVSIETIEKLIEVGIHAPSACNMQDWRFIVIDDDAIKKEIYDLGGAITIRDCPICILVCYDNRTDNVEYKDHIQSASASIQNMLLYANKVKLGACWINQLPTKKQLRKLLSIPKHFDPIAIIAIGYYDNSPKFVPRKYDIKEIYSINTFNFSIPEVSDPKKSRWRRFFRKIYYRMPKFFKKKTRSGVEKDYVRKF